MFTLLSNQISITDDIVLANKIQFLHSFKLWYGKKKLIAFDEMISKQPRTLTTGGIF